MHLINQCNAGKLDYQARREEKKGKLKLNAMESMMTFETAKGFVAGQAGRNYPAPVEAIKVMQKHSRHDPRQGDRGGSQGLRQDGQDRCLPQAWLACS